MLKSLAAFSHTFSLPKDYSGIVNTVLATEKCSALFLSGYGIQTVSGKVLYWKDAIDSSNYLYATGALPSSTGSYSMANAPAYIASDGIFNTQPSVDFSDNGNTRLLLANPVRAKCVVLVYLTRNTESYIIYAPRTIPGSSAANTIYYDAFPPGEDGALWSDEPLLNGSVYNARSRINARDVDGDQTISAGIARCLSVSGINERIDGFGGKTGKVGGINPEVELDDSLSVQGKIAAIALFDEDLTDEELLNVETSLGLLYLQYQGIQKLENPPLTFTINQTFSIDLNFYFNDEWFNLELFELVSPPSELPLLNITDGILSGVASNYYEGTISIKITNSNNFSQIFQVPIRCLEVDELYQSIKEIYEPMFIFSGDYNKGFYGDRWEDTRRLNTTKLSYTSPVFQLNNVSFNSSYYIFTDTASLTLDRSYNIRSLVYVYRQTIGGVRRFSNQHDDIYGTGNLLTVASPNDIFGNSAKTRWKSYVQTVQVSSFSYKLPLYEEVFVCFTNADLMSVNEFPSLRGDVAYIIGFSQELTALEIRELIAILAERYYTEDTPLVFDTSIHFSTTENVQVNLNNRVVDLKGKYPLSFELLAPVYDASISQGILSLTAELDERLSLNIEATNSDNLYTTFTLQIDTLIKDNQLYRDLRSTGVLFNNVYIPTADSIQATTWLEYSGNGSDAELIGTQYITSPLFDSKPVLRFNSNGSSYAEFDTAIEGNLFVFAYKRSKDASDLAFLLGQNTLSDFFSGTNGQFLHPSLSINPEATFLNGDSINKTYQLASEVVSILIIKTSQNYSIDSIAKHKLFTTDSVKGDIGLVAIAQHVGAVPYNDIFLAVKAYYLPAKELLNMPLLNNLSDVSDGISRISGNALFSSSLPSLRIGASRAVISNDSQYAFQLMDFQIKFDILPFASEGRLSILKMPLLEIYVQNNVLTISDQGNRTVNVNISYGVFNSIVITRQNKTLTVGSQSREWNVNYIDYASPVVLGDFTASRTEQTSVRNLVISRL